MSFLHEWFIDNKVSICFGDDKTKSISFTWEKRLPKLNMLQWDYSLKQYDNVEYLRRYLRSNLNGELMTPKVLKRINSKLNFLWKENNYLKYVSRRLLFNDPVKPDFDYGYISWYAVLKKQLSLPLLIWRYYLLISLLSLIQKYMHTSR